MAIHARVTDGRLHLYTYEGSSGKSASRELDIPQLALGKTGIAVKKWYHLFSKSVKLRIGNTTYDINANSLKKYLLRTSGMSVNNKDYKKCQDVALNAFKSKANDIFSVIRPETESTCGLMLLRHAKALDLRQNPQSGTRYSSLNQISIERGEELTQKPVWEEFFQQEVTAYNDFHRNERVSQKHLHRSASLSSLEIFLQAFNEACQLEKTLQGLYPGLQSLAISPENREEILSLAQSLNPEQQKELAEKMAASNKLIKASAPYIQLKIQEKKLTDQEASLRSQIDGFDKRAAQKNEAHVFFQTVLQVLRSNLQIKEQPEAMVEIPEMAIEKIKAENPSLAQQLANYNRELNKFQEDHRILQERVELFERDLARRNATYLHYAELRSTAKLMLTGRDFQLQRHGLNFQDFVAQYNNVGLSIVQQDIDSFRRDIETNKAYAKDPLTNLEIGLAQNHLEVFKGQIKLLKSHPKPDEIDTAMQDLRAQVTELNLRYIDLQTSLRPEEVSSNLQLQQELKILNGQIKDCEERLEIYGVLLAKEDTTQLLQDKKAVVKDLEVHLKHLKEKRTDEIGQRNKKCKELEAVIKELEKILKSKTKEFQAFASRLAKEENVSFKGNLETEVTNYLKEMKSSAQGALHSLKEEVRTLNEQKEHSLNRIQTIAGNVETNLVSSQPERLTPEQKDQMLQEYGQVSQQLSEVKAAISHNYHIHGKDLRSEIEAAAGRPLSLKEAFAYGAHAYLLNLEFLSMATQLDQGKITSKESNFLIRREQTLNRAKEVRKLFDKLSIEYPSDHANLSMFVFSGAQQSLFDKFPDQLRKSDHPSYLMRRFLNYLRENSSRDAESIGDDFSQISGSSASSFDRSSSLRSNSMAQSLTDSAYASASSSPSFRSMNFASSQASSSRADGPIDFDSPDKYATTFNPIYQQLISDINPVNKGAQQFIRSLEDWDLTYFTHPDKSKRLDPQQHQPLLCPATSPLYSLFIGGDDLTGIKLNYPAMINYLDQKGEVLARSIRERETEQNPIPSEELSIILSYYIFAEGLKNPKDPHAKDKFISQLKAFCPEVLDILHKHKISH